MKPPATEFYRRPALVLLALSCLLLILECAPLIHTRWVEDESWLSSTSWTFVQEGRMRSPIFPASPRYIADVSPPVHALSMAAAFKVFGVGITPARGMSAVAALAFVAVVFLLGLEINGWLCAAGAALLLSTDTFLVIAARTARPEAHTALLSWLAVLLYYRAARLDSWKLSACAGLACGVAMSTHPLALPFTAWIAVVLLLRYRGSSWRTPLVWAFATGAVLGLAPYALWCFSDAAHVAAFKDTYLSKAAEPFRGRIVGELDRWRDFIGLSTQRVRLPVPIPVRLHIAALLAAAFVFLFRKRPELARSLALLLLLNVLWWLYMVNKGPRYLVLISPIFALVLSYLLSRAREFGRGKAIAAAVVVVLATQLAANAYWIYKFRSADYPAVARQLQAIVPPGAKVYGATTFWMALHDRTYYAYDRTTLDYAVRNLHPEYLILNDRVMVGGSGHGEDDFGALRIQAAEYVRAHGVLAGRVSNDFYGDLQIYRIEK
jgi:hypothetical protein